MKFGLLQNLVIGGLVTALSVFSLNTIATFAQVPEDSSDRHNMPMNRNLGEMQPIMQMMQDMTPEQRQAMRKHHDYMMKHLQEMMNHMEQMQQMMNQSGDKEPVNGMNEIQSQ